MNRKKNSNDFIDLDQVFEIIEEEKKFEPNPFLTSKILSSIGNSQVEQMRIYRPAGLKLLNPTMISLSVAAAVTIGIIIGSLYSPYRTSNSADSDFKYMNDAAIESVMFLSND